ncbi:MAG: type II toxin-antitoxin system HicB family antitoxin [Cyanobacteria bacterium RI_101]|nr:type II toxin-antitoxin system HicB family antitoxin [Cyanobacteria bacterium RI_101]
MNIHYSMVILWSEEDHCYLVHLPDFPCQRFHTHGDTYEEAARHGAEVIDSYLALYRESDQPLPEPRGLFLDFQAA